MSLSHLWPKGHFSLGNCGSRVYTYSAAITGVCVCGGGVR